METLVDIIWIMMNLRKDAENLGKMIMIIYVLIDRKRRIKEDTVFVMKSKTHILNIHLKKGILAFVTHWARKIFSVPFSEIIYWRIYSIKNIHKLEHLEELADLQSELKQVRMVEKLGKQGFQYDIKELFEPITKAVTESNQKLLEENKSTTKAIEELKESSGLVKDWELMN